MLDLIILLELASRWAKFCEILSHNSRYCIYASTFWLKFGSLSPAVTLKISSRSPKPNQLFIMSQCYIHADLVRIHLPVPEISCKQESVTLTPMPTPTGSAPKTMSPAPSVSDIIKLYTTANIN